MLLEHLLKLHTCLQSEAWVWTRPVTQAHISVHSQKCHRGGESWWTTRREQWISCFAFSHFPSEFNVIIKQRQWGVILIHKQCLPKKSETKVCVICVKELHERHHRISVPARWVCRQTMDSLSQLIGHWSHGTGTCMDLHVPSTDPSTLCRNAGGNKLWWFKCDSTRQHYWQIYIRDQKSVKNLI